MNLYLSTLKAIATRYPAVIPHLKGRARFIIFALTKPRETFDNLIYSDIKLFKVRMLSQGLDASKTYDYFLAQLQGLIRGVYENNVGREFLDIMANLISGQLTQAFEQAWKDEEGVGGMPDYLNNELESMILNQYDYVDGLYNDIVNARVLGKPLDPILARAPLWAQRWTEAYNKAVALITAENGGNMVWQLGATEQHCTTCAGLDGIVMRASEWDALGVHPQGGPNPVLDCQGWNCDCSLTPTDKRRSPKAYETVMNIVSK